MRVILLKAALDNANFSVVFCCANERGRERPEACWCQQLQREPALQQVSGRRSSRRGGRKCERKRAAAAAGGRDPSRPVPTAGGGRPGRRVLSRGGPGTPSAAPRPQLPSELQRVTSRPSAPGRAPARASECRRALSYTPEVCSRAASVQALPQAGAFEQRAPRPWPRPPACERGVMLARRL